MLVSSSSWFIFEMYSFLSMTTRATPLSAVTTRRSLSDLSSLMAFHSSLEMLGLVGFVCFKILAISALNSSASDVLRLWQANSTAVM